MSFNINIINPYIRRATNSVLTENYIFNTRVLFDYELLYIEQGNMKLEYNGKTYNTKTGDVILLHPRVPHAIFNSNNKLYQPHIHFDLVYDSNSTHRYISFKNIDVFSNNEKDIIHKDYLIGNNLSPFITFNNKNKFLKLFKKIVDNSNSNPLLMKSKFTEIIYMIISDNYRNLITSNNTETKDIEEQIKEFVEQNFTSNLSLDDIQAYFNYNKFYLDRKFKKRFNISIMKYRNNIRLDYAKEILRTKSVSEVSNALGYSSLYVFSRAFSAHFGFNPSSINEQDNNS